MASFTVARDIFVHKEDFLLVDIAGEVTDISMVKKDVLVNSISYPLGYNFIVRKLAENLNCDLNEAKSLISLYKNGHAEENVEKKLEPVVSKLKTEWLSKFQESLTNLSDDISVPATIFITVDQDLTDFFSKIIKSNQFNRYTLTEPEFQIIFLDVNILNGITSFKEDTDRDPFMIIESIYLNRFIC
jgi:cell division ATPase FtsA